MGKSLSDLYVELTKLVTEISDDVTKTVKGNKASGTRVRNTMQDIKNKAQEIRTAVLELRKKK